MFRRGLTSYLGESQIEQKTKHRKVLFTLTIDMSLSKHFQSINLYLQPKLIILSFIEIDPGHSNYDHLEPDIDSLKHS